MGAFGRIPPRPKVQGVGYLILLTTGSELPFNRLVQAVDAWCGLENRSDVFGQLGDIGPDDYQPKNFTWTRFLTPAEYKERFDEADAIIAHAGMGSIISALMSAKPIVIMARRLSYMETRNDHQVATVERFSTRPGVFAALDEKEVPTAIQAMLSSTEHSIEQSASKFADEKLIETLRDFILE